MFLLNSEQNLEIKKNKKTNESRRIDLTNLVVILAF